jgi:hypothetical protein
VSRTILVAVALASLALAPAAAAKGPHAIVEPGPEGIAPGERWVATLSLNEFSARALARARPRVILRSGRDRLVVRPVRTGAARYRLSAVFPRAGQWSYVVLAGTRRFEFPATDIGAGERDTMGYVAFPEGSDAERQGAGGPYVSPPPGGESSPSAGGESLPPEVVMADSPGGDGDGGGLAWWIPAAGLALVGAGTLTAVRRRR